LRSIPTFILLGPHANQQADLQDFESPASALRKKGSAEAVQMRSNDDRKLTRTAAVDDEREDENEAVRDAP